MTINRKIFWVFVVIYVVVVVVVVGRLPNNLSTAIKKFKAICYIQVIIRLVSFICF
jgi:uncharacterized membrane protein YhaH (DUF805 family)